MSMAEGTRIYTLVCAMPSIMPSGSCKTCTAIGPGRCARRHPPEIPHNRGDDGMPQRSDRLEIGDDGQHLILCHIFDHAVHDRCAAKHTLNHEQLFQQIRRMLPRQARKKCETLAMRTVT